jgi:hypothetical protein
MATLKLAAVFAQKQNSQTQTDNGDNRLFTATAEQTNHLPFASLLLGTSSNFMRFNENSCIGLYLVSERSLLNKPLDKLKIPELPASVGIFPMVANPRIGAAAADKHWQNVHAPLALEVHNAMTHYYQLSVGHRFFGPDWNGLALCCFASETDLREKMYKSAEGRRRIGEDIGLFADTLRSPRRVVATVS